MHVCLNLFNLLFSFYYAEVRDLSHFSDHIMMLAYMRTLSVIVVAN